MYEYKHRIYPYVVYVRVFVCLNLDDMTYD